MTKEVVAGGERRRNVDGPAAVLSDKLALAPQSRREITGNETSLVYLELRYRLVGERHEHAE